MKVKLVKIILVLVGLIYFPLLIALPWQDFLFKSDELTVAVQISKFIAGTVAFIGFSLVMLTRAKR